MKTSFLCLFASLTLVLCGDAWAQTPEPALSPAVTSPVATAPVVTPVPTVALTPVPTIAPVPTVAPAATVASSPKDEDDDDIDASIEKKIRKHFNIDIDSHSHRHVVDDSDVPWIAVPIVFIVFLTIFGVPVAIVGLIMYFSFSKSRAMHKTVRMMVEKGQPVPESLLNPPPVVRQRSDLRRGIVLLTVGAGLMIFFGAINDWEGGVWSLGIIPFMIGLGYLLAWKFGAHKEEKTSNSSPRV